MINAEIARQAAETAQTSKIENELKIFDKNITDKIDDGKFSIYHYDRITEGTKKELEKLGYEVSEIDDQRDGYTATITW